MIASNMHKNRPRRGGSRGRKGVWMLAVTGVSLAAVMGLMMASANQIPYGATQVWSAEATSAFQSAAPSVIGSPAIGSGTYGQDVGSLPAVTLTRVGAR